MLVSLCDEEPFCTSQFQWNFLTRLQLRGLILIVSTGLAVAARVAARSHAGAQVPLGVRPLCVAVHHQFAVRDLAKDVADLTARSGTYEGTC